MPNREAERPLSEAGNTDAERVADLLSDVDLDAVISSPYARARQTVEPVAERRGMDVEFWRDELTTPDVYEAHFEDEEMVGIERRWPERD